MFKSRKFEKTGPDAYRITGDLTMLGVTKPMTVSATRVGSGKVPWGGVPDRLHHGIYHQTQRVWNGLPDERFGR